MEEVKEKNRIGLKIFAVFAIILFILSLYIFIANVFIKKEINPEKRGFLHTLENANPLNLIRGSFNEEKIYGALIDNDGYGNTCQGLDDTTCSGQTENFCRAEQGLCVEHDSTYRCFYNAMEPGFPCETIKVCNGLGACVECVDNSNCVANHPGEPMCDMNTYTCVTCSVKICSELGCGFHNNDGCGNPIDCGACPPLGGGGSGGGGGGGGGGFTTFTINENEFKKGASRNLEEEDRFKFTVSNQYHYLILKKINSAPKTIDITISSNPKNATLSMGDKKKFDITNDSYYDIEIKFNSINNGKANITIKSIHELEPGFVIPMNETGTPNINQTGNVSGGQESPQKNSFNIFVLIISTIVLIIIIVLVILIVSVYLKIKKVSEIKKKEPVKRGKEEMKVQPENEDYSKGINREIEELLSQGYNLLNKGNIANAKTIYFKIKKKYNLKEDKDRKIYNKIFEFYRKIIKSEKSEK